MQELLQLCTAYSIVSALGRRALGGRQREERVVKSYTALTQNMFKHLAHGEEVQYGTFRVKTVDGKIIVRGVLQDGREMELHYRLRQGKEAGFSKEQFKNIFAFREKPLFSINIRSRRAVQTA
jgi:hypothetical protein